MNIVNKIDLKLVKNNCSIQKQENRKVNLLNDLKREEKITLHKENELRLLKQKYAEICRITENKKK